MSIANLLRSHFGSDVRGRGAPYFHSGAVRLEDGDAGAVWATVKGTSRYNIAMVLDGNELYMECSCPHFADVGCCKHLWATVLAADQHGYLSDLANLRDFRICFDDDDGDYGFDDEDDDDDFGDGRRPASSRTIVHKAKSAKPASWSRVFGQVKQSLQSPAPVYGGYGAPQHYWPADRELLYVIDLPSSVRTDVSLDLGFRDRKKNGDWAKPKFQYIPQALAEKITAEQDVQILALLFGAQKVDPYGYNYGHYNSGVTRFNLTPSRTRAILPLVGKTGRLFLRTSTNKDELLPLVWNDEKPWEFRLSVEAQGGKKGYRVTGVLQRDAERRLVSEPTSLLPAGIAIWPDRTAGFIDDGGASAWLKALREESAVKVDAKKKDEFLRDLLLMRVLPPVDLPEDMRVAEEAGVPKPRILIRAPEGNSYRNGMLYADLSFEYAERVIAYGSPDRGVYEADSRRMIVRDRVAEESATALLLRSGFRVPNQYYRGESDFELPTRQLPKATRVLLEAGWRVEADGKLYRPAGAVNIEVTTGIDWFDLEGDIQFGDQSASFPRLLQALQRGENTIQLDDGTFGMLPDDWLKKYGMLAGLGQHEDDKLRFSRMQVGLLDAMLASMPDVSFDKAFRKVADELRTFEGIAAVDPPPEFTGTLREYQREGLGWLQFLERFGFGGCLADDMGLGKTVQVLAHLADRAKAKKKGAKKLPTLIVVPRSLIFNWKQESARFAPDLRVLDHSGPERDKTTDRFADFDVIVTTYGILRRDVLLFKDAKFDYCILDEAQTVKNASTDQAKATKLLQANHRLAMSGTPIENHLGELWNLFEFLNPGLLGHASLFKLSGGATRNPEPETRAVLAKGLRPFILRRTKQQVAKDLPEKTEQTLYCELEPEQRKLYNELRDHYRMSLLKTIEAVGMNRAKIQVLEALLRLRQAACHPGLIDKKKAAEPSAKLDMLLPQLKEIHEEGQKALVFSQFTSLLSIVRSQLDRENIAYEYLDGKTRNRQEKVEHFQNDPDCKLFLISLKAGGIGLNLTAAEYVFLLDPWWNPAVEAQAIDRTHRIGQTRPVFAYRLIAKDTVEEKVLELQKTKRDLADAILNADNSVISNLKREDLEMLLS